MIPQDITLQTAQSKLRTVSADSGIQDIDRCIRIQNGKPRGKDAMIDRLPVKYGIKAAVRTRQQLKTALRYAVPQKSDRWYRVLRQSVLLCIQQLCDPHRFPHSGFSSRVSG